MSEGERLAKRVAALVPCSRNAAERYIEGGWVRVDGQVVEEPQFRVQQQTIQVDAHATLKDLPPVTLVLHKPVGWRDDDPGQLVPANHHMGDKALAVRVLQRHFKQQRSLVPLETNASGLVVYTQDWRVERKLTEDRDFLEHEYLVDVPTSVTDASLRALKDLLVQDRSLPQVKVSLGSRTGARSTLRFAVKGAHVGLMEYLCQQVHLPLGGIRRIRLGRVALRDLPPGQWRYLAPQERF